MLQLQSSDKERLSIVVNHKSIYTYNLVDESVAFSVVENV